MINTVGFSLTPAGEKLDRFLKETVEQFRGEQKMPEVGSKAALSPLKEALLGVKRAADTAAQAIIEQAHKQAAEIEANGHLVVKKMDSEHQEAMGMFNDILGNERAEDQ